MLNKNSFHLLLVFCLGCISFTSSAKWYQNTFEVMGTQSHIEFWLPESENSATSEAYASKAQSLIADIQEEMHRIDREMSPYKVNSKLSFINNTAAIRPVEISEELFELLSFSQYVAKQSDGAFDITYASIGYQYDYRENKKPSQQAISRALSAINYLGVVLDKKKFTVSFTHKNIKIDLGGIAKGYAVKRCLAILKSAGVNSGLVSAGGDTGLIGDRNGRPWLVGIKHPRAEDKTAVRIPLENEAISTSGDYERYFIEDGVRYHHIINPKTGDSARKVVSVSIIGNDPTYVDALSTTVFVLGLEKGMDFINSLAGYEAIIINNEQKMFFSKGIQ